MKKSDVISYFGNMARAMKAIGVSRSTAVKWGEIVPIQHAIRFMVASNGELQLGVDDYVPQNNRQSSQKAA